MADQGPLHKAMVQLGTIILPLGLILARRRLGLEEQRGAAKGQVVAAPQAAVPRVARRVGMEAAAPAVAPTVAGAGVLAAAVTETMFASGDGSPSPSSPRRALILQNLASLKLQDHILFVEILVTDLECRAFHSEGLEAKRAIEGLGCGLAGGHS